MTGSITARLCRAIRPSTPSSRIFGRSSGRSSPKPAIPMPEKSSDRRLTYPATPENQRNCRKRRKEFHLKRIVHPRGKLRRRRLSVCRSWGISQKLLTSFPTITQGGSLKKINARAGGDPATGRGINQRLLTSFPTLLNGEVDDPVGLRA